MSGGQVLDRRQAGTGADDGRDGIDQDGRRRLIPRHAALDPKTDLRRSHDMDRIIGLPAADVHAKIEGDDLLAVLDPLGGVLDPRHIARLAAKRISF